ncbi:hypothetical protein [Azospirillum canadense]|uniref:hypothetical protein n=1 Tax=Azospirillum canadense TaxID=403962 RepID=UPI0022261814|nr:hypothetical protein [Azospirillum canadense]MCW2240967.1 hypothetical protein [Azospirillum canadense]
MDDDLRALRARRLALIEWARRTVERSRRTVERSRALQEAMVLRRQTAPGEPDGLAPQPTSETATQPAAALESAVERKPG